MPEELTPELRQILDYLQQRSCQYISVREVRIALNLTNGQARGRLWRLTRLGYIVTHLIFVIRPHIRRRWFHFIPKLYRIKIRLYTEERAPTPEGAFQGWFDIDARVDPDTGLVDWTYWLTQELIEIAKFHFLGYWKGLAGWREPEQIGLAYFFEKELAEKGIHAPEKSVSYPEPTRAYIQKAGIPEEYMRRAERLKVKDVIVGESSVAPRPVKNLDEEGGVFFQQVMLIVDGAVKWQQRLDYYSWKLASAPAWLERVKKELGMV